MSPQCQQQKVAPDAGVLPPVAGRSHCGVTVMETPAHHDAPAGFSITIPHGDLGCFGTAATFSRWGSGGTRSAHGLICHFVGRRRQRMATIEKPAMVTSCP